MLTWTAAAEATLTEGDLQSRPPRCRPGAYTGGAADYGTVLTSSLAWVPGRLGPLAAGFGGPVPTDTAGSASGGRVSAIRHFRPPPGLVAGGRYS